MLEEWISNPFYENSKIPTIVIDALNSDVTKTWKIETLRCRKDSIKHQVAAGLAELTHLFLNLVVFLHFSNIQ